MRQLDRALKPALTDLSADWGSSANISQTPYHLPPIFGGGRIIIYGFLPDQVDWKEEHVRSGEPINSLQWANNIFLWFRQLPYMLRLELDPPLPVLHSIRTSAKQRASCYTNWLQNPWSGERKYSGEQRVTLQLFLEIWKMDAVICTMLAENWSKETKRKWTKRWSNCPRNRESFRSSLPSLQATNFFLLSSFSE